MKVSNWLVWLPVLVAALGVVAALAGLLSGEAGAPFPFTTVRGETVPMYGQGLYRYEIMRDGVGFKGVDLFVLGVGVPLLLLCTLLYRRGSLRGGLLLTSALGYFLYNAASMTFGYAYNHFFLVYLAQFTASLFAFILALTSFDLAALPDRFSDDLPRRRIAAFLFAVGVSLILVWVGLDILPALLQGKAPPLNGHTTLPTHALDVGVIAPAAFLAAVLLLRRTGLGYLLTAVILIVGAVLGAGVCALSAAQVAAGVLTTAETFAFVAPFVVLTLLSLGCTVVLFRHLVEDGRPARRSTLRPLRN
ncbi:MAG: hypothetical protein KIT87_08410 [Anaerolineae bacterium]|nr:hypothetical protein [Anaerolineae bacterium]